LLLAVEWPTRPVRLEIGGYWLHASPVLLLAQGVILAGAVGWARLMLGVHTPRQVWYGYAIGFTGALAAWWATGR
jgi:PAP2 superfamily.